MLAQILGAGENLMPIAGGGGGGGGQGGEATIHRVA